MIRVIYLVGIVLLSCSTNKITRPIVRTPSTLVSNDLYDFDSAMVYFYGDNLKYTGYIGLGGLKLDGRKFNLEFHLETSGDEFIDSLKYIVKNKGLCKNRLVTGRSDNSLFRLTIMKNNNIVAVREIVNPQREKTLRNSCDWTHYQLVNRINTYND